MQAARKSTKAGGIALVLAIAAGGCSKMEQNAPRKNVKTQAQAKRQKMTCGSAAAYDRLKALLFDQAAGERRGNPNNLDTLADYSFVRMEEPVVKSWDPALDITSCRGRLVLEIPRGAEQAFAGERHLQADVDYTAQAAADGNGFVYQLKGAEPITDKLATFNLTNMAYRPSPAIDDQPEEPVLSEQARSVGDGLPPPPLSPRRSLPTQTEELRSTARKGAPPQAAAERSMSDGADAASSVLTRQQGLLPKSVARPEGAAPKNSPQIASAAQPAEARVRAFYDALAKGDGSTASAQVIPEKQSSRAFSPEAISRFYGRLPEPIRLTGLTRVEGGDYRVSYRYSAGQSHCDGSAVVSVTRRGNRDYIRSIRALSGC